MNDYKDISALINGLKQNQSDAYAYLYDNYAGALYGVITKIIQDQDEAADLLQDAFMRISQNIEHYQADKGSLFTWMLNIARNRAIDALRKKQRAQQNQGSSSGVSNDAILQMHSSFSTNVDAIGLDTIVNELKPDLKEMIDLHYFGGMTQQEIADEKNMPLGSVKTKMRTAMQQLKSIFDIK